MTNITSRFFISALTQHRKSLPFVLLVISLCLPLCLVLQPAARVAESMPALQGEEAITYLKQQQLYPSLAEAMRAAQYGIYASEPTMPADAAPSSAARSSASAASADSFYANNPAQQMSAVFTAGGIDLRSQATSAEGWRLGMQLRQIGYGNHLCKVTAGDMQAVDKRIEIARRVGSQGGFDSRLSTPDSRLVEWYENRADGIEQGFRLAAAPAGRGLGERLRLQLAVEGDLQARLADAGQAIDFINQAGERSLRYDKLKVWDADNNELAAGISVESNNVWLEVDDEGAAYPVTIDPIFSQEAKLTAADGAKDDQLGAAVAISGETAVVGAPFSAVGTNKKQGSAYIFLRTGTAWKVQRKLTALDGAADDLFGIAVAISGETAVIGALSDDLGEGFNQGSAYVFVRRGIVWSEQQKLTASDGETFDFFGNAVAINGETIVVGDSNDTIGTNATQGSAYVFVRTGSTWSQQQKLVAADGAKNDLFAEAVAISGETIVVGTGFDDTGTNVNQGSAYVFVRAGTTWSQQQKLTASDGQAFDFFGNAIAISGETIVVGSPSHEVGTHTDQGAAYVFTRAGTVWSLQQKIAASDGNTEDEFGGAVAISGETLVIGSRFSEIRGNSNQGAAYIFARTGTVWSQQQKLAASDGADSDLFGSAIAISGETIIAGARSDDVGTNSNQGSAYVFTCVGSGRWAEQEMVITADGGEGDNFGSAVAISGETVIIGAPSDDIGMNENQGSAYIFVRAGTVWGVQQKLTVRGGEANDAFGNAVAIDGETAIVGAPTDDVLANADQGSAYIFVRNAGVWHQWQALLAADGATGDNFGSAVGISGETVIVGAVLDDLGANADQGSAYVFVRVGTVWNQEHRMTAADGEAFDLFGNAVAISGETAIVGAFTDDVGANIDQGSAYVFARAGTTWSQQQRLIAADGASRDHFGSDVAISGETAIVGAPLNKVGTAVEQGSAYLFARLGTVWNQQQKLAASDGASGDWFGYSVGISGETAIVGVRNDAIGASRNQGSAYVFARLGTVWNQQQRLIAADGEANDFFGVSVAISGKTAIVGAPSNDLKGNTDQGSAYVFFTSCGCP